HHMPPTSGRGVGLNLWQLLDDPGVTNGGALGARGGLMAASAVVALVAAGCGGSSSGGERPALIGLPQSTGAASAGPATQIASAPCQHPTDDITTALAPHLAADVQVDKAALLQ